MAHSVRRRTVFITALIVCATACADQVVTPSTTIGSTPPATDIPKTTPAESVPTITQPTTTMIPPTTTTSEAGPIEFAVTYSDGAVTGGGRLEVPLGQAVQITIDTDTADEAHLHGYDIFADLEPGVPGVIEFIAEIPGIFEFELESSGVLLAELEVAP